MDVDLVESFIYCHPEISKPNLHDFIIDPIVCWWNEPTYQD